MNNYEDFDTLVLEERVMAICRLALPMITSIAGYLGFAFDAEAAWSIICAVIGLVSTIAAWWFNNNMTRNAVKAQKTLSLDKKIDKSLKTNTNKDVYEYLQNNKEDHDA